MVNASDYKLIYFTISEEEKNRVYYVGASTYSAVNASSAEKYLKND